MFYLSTLTVVLLVSEAQDSRPHKFLQSSVFFHRSSVSVSWLIILDLSPNILLWNVLSTQTASCFSGLYSLLRRVMYIPLFTPLCSRRQSLSPHISEAALQIHFSISALAPRAAVLELSWILSVWASSTVSWGIHVTCWHASPVMARDA